MCSNTHIVSRRRGGTACSTRKPCESQISSSPGFSSRTAVAPMMSSAGVSEATTGEPSRSPSTSGRMPSGSRNASSVSSLRTTAENAPRMRSIACTAPSASVPGWCAMSAQMTSVSEVEPSRTPCSMQLRAQLVGVREVAVVPERDRAARAVGDDRLRVHPVRRAGRRVAGVPDRRAPREGLQLALVEDLRDEPHVAHGEHAPAVADGDARALLPAVLQRVEREVGEAGDVAAGRVDAEDAAHQPAPIARGRASS